jgi:hypothetical protein
VPGTGDLSLVPGTEDLPRTQPARSALVSTWWMAPRAESGRGPLGRLTLAAGVLLGLLLVVALASRGGLGEGGGEATPRHALLDRLFTGFFVLFLLYIPVAAWLYWNQRRNATAEMLPRRRSTLASLITFGSILALVFLLVRYRDRLGLDALHAPHGGGTAAATTAAGTTTPDRYEPQFDWRAAIVVLGVAAAAAGTFFAMRRPDEEGGPEPLWEQLAYALDDSLDDLLAERDPRKAVIAAYARMERALGAAGVPRVPHEAPLEYVARALRDLDVGEDAVRRLTDLFERAKFSTHEIDEGMRDEAIAALVRVRDELRSTAEREAVA